MPPDLPIRGIIKAELVIASNLGLPLDITGKPEIGSPQFARTGPWSIVVDRDDAPAVAVLAACGVALSPPALASRCKRPRGRIKAPDSHSG